MNFVGYKKISTSTGALKKKAEEFRKINIQKDELDKYLQMEEKKFKIGYWLFIGQILFGIAAYFFWGNYQNAPKKSGGKNKCNNFNLVKIG